LIEIPAWPAGNIDSIDGLVGRPIYQKATPSVSRSLVDSQIDC
jgi:hypothetical protein